MYEMIHGLRMMNFGMVLGWKMIEGWL